MPDKQNRKHNLLMHISASSIRSWLLPVRLIATLAMIASFSSSFSMEFSTAQRFGDTVIIGKGVIVNGDDKRLAAIVSRADLLAHGYRILELDSPGGNVDAALALAKIIDEYQFHTVISKGSECASACGAVLFVAGHLRTMENGSRLGMHTCYDSQTSMPNSRCNDEIGKHAFSKGVAHGAVHAYMAAVPPEEMLWLNRERAECAGLTKYFMEFSNDYDPMGPCFQKALYGSEPDPVMKWRVKRREGGFAAFVRSMSDYQEVAQTEIFCSEKKPGIIHVAATFPGGDDEKSDKLERMVVELDDKIFSTTRPEIRHRDGYTTFTYALPASEVKNFFKSYKEIVVSLKFNFDPNPFSFGAELTHGREALLFAANNCLP